MVTFTSVSIEWSGGGRALYLPSELGSHISAGSALFSVCRTNLSSSSVMVPSLTAARSQRRAVLPTPLMLSTSARRRVRDKCVNKGLGAQKCGGVQGRQCIRVSATRTPDGPGAATVSAVHQNDLQVPLTDPFDQARVVATGTAIGEGDARHGEAGTSIDAVDGHLERHRRVVCTHAAAADSQRVGQCGGQCGTHNQFSYPHVARSLQMPRQHA